MNVLEIENLRKTFGGVQAVDGISFDVKEGETVGIIGPNGAGKTTVFNLITGLYRPDGGSVRFYKQEITKLAQHKLPLLGIVRTFQNLRLFSNLTVFENVLAATLGKKGYGALAGAFRMTGYFVNESKAEQEARRLIEFFGLNGKEDLSAGSLPYGEQRRLELARALATGPKLLLIDEPGAGMNQREIKELVDMINEVKERFLVSIIIIEHQMGLVMNVSDKVIVMDFGEKIMEGTPDEVKSDRRVIEAYLGEAFAC